LIPPGMKGKNAPKEGGIGRASRISGNELVRGRNVKHIVPQQKEEGEPKLFRSKKNEKGKELHGAQNVRRVRKGNLPHKVRMSGLFKAMAKKKGNKTESG